MNDSNYDVRVTYNDAVEILRWAPEIIIELHGQGKMVVTEKKLSAAGDRMFLKTGHATYDVLITAGMPMAWLSKNRDAIIVPRNGHPYIVWPLYPKAHDASKTD